MAAKLVSTAAVALLAIGLAGCGGGLPAKTISTPPPAPAGPATTITISPATASLETSLGQQLSTLQFTATVQNPATAAVKWNVNGVAGGDPTVGTVSATGLYTAPYTPPGQVYVSVELAADPQNKATAVVTVTWAAQITINAPEGVSVAVNNRIPLDAVVLANCTSDVAWAIDGDRFGSDSSGYLLRDRLNSRRVWYLAPSAPPDKPVVVTATMTAVPTKSAAAGVTVTAAPIASLTISPATVSLAPGAQQVFSAARGGGSLAVTWLLDGSSETDVRVGWLRDGIYTAPSLPPDPATVLVTAVDTASTPPQYATARVNVVPSNSNGQLRGTFAVLLQHDARVWLATLTFDGAGNVSGRGYSFMSVWLTLPLPLAPATSASVHAAGAVSGTYNLGANGYAVVQAKVPAVGSAEPFDQTLHFYFTSADRAEVAAGTDFGIAERQTDPALHPGRYVTAMQRTFAAICGGYGPCVGLNDIAHLGSVDIDAAGTISGKLESADVENRLSNFLVSGMLKDELTASLSLQQEGNSPIAYEAIAVPVNDGRFYFAGASTGAAVVQVISGISERSLASDAVPGPYVFHTRNTLGHLLLGAGAVSGNMDFKLFQMLSSIQVAGAGITAQPEASASGRVYLPIIAAPQVAPSVAAVLPKWLLAYQVSPERLLLLDAFGGHGEMYLQAPPLASPESILGDYVLRGAIHTAEGPGWMRRFAGEDGYGVVSGSSRQPAAFTFMSPLADGCGEADVRVGNSASPVPAVTRYCAVSNELLLFLGRGEMRRQRW